MPSSSSKALVFKWLSSRVALMYSILARFDAKERKRGKENSLTRYSIIYHLRSLFIFGLAFRSLRATNTPCPARLGDGAFRSNARIYSMSKRGCRSRISGQGARRCSCLAQRNILYVHTVFLHPGINIE